MNFLSGNLGNRTTSAVKLKFCRNRSSGVLSAQYKNEVSNCCAIQKELNLFFHLFFFFFAQVNFVRGNLGNK